MTIVPITSGATTEQGIQIQEVQKEQEKPPEQKPVEVPKPVVSGYRYGNWVGNESGDFWQNTRTGERVYGDPYHFRENPRTEVLGTAKDVPRVSYTGSLTTGQAQDMPKGTPVAFAKGSTIEQKYTDTLISRQEQAKAQEAKASQIQKMLESPTAQFGSQAALQRAYDIVATYKPDFRPEQVQATIRTTKISEKPPTREEFDFTGKVVEEGGKVYEKLPSISDFGVPKPSLGIREGKTVIISPEIKERMKGIDIEKIDIGSQLQKLKLSEEKLKSFEPLIKDGEFKGTRTQYIEYRKTLDTYNKDTKILEDVYKARESESLSSGLLRITQKTSRELQTEADKLIGVSKETTPGVRTTVSGVTSVFTGLPEFAGGTIFAGEQIIRHPSEIVAIAKVGVPLFISQQKTAFTEDPYKFGGSLVGMIALGKVGGKVPEGIKSTGKYISELEPASGITSLKEVLPKPDVTMRSEALGAARLAAKETIVDISKEIKRTTQRKVAFIASQELFGDVYLGIKKELYQPTIRKESFQALKEELPTSAILKEPTRGKEAVEAVKEITKETKVGLEKELKLPTRGKESVSSVVEILREGVPEFSLKETERGRGLIELGKTIKYELEKPAGGYPKREKYWKTPTKEYLESKYKTYDPLLSGRKLIDLTPPEIIEKGYAKKEWYKESTPESVKYQYRIYDPLESGRQVVLEPRPPIITEKGLYFEKKITPQKPIGTILRELAGKTTEAERIIGTKYGKEMMPKKVILDFGGLKPIGKVPITEIIDISKAEPLRTTKYIEEPIVKPEFPKIKIIEKPKTQKINIQKELEERWKFREEKLKKEVSKGGAQVTKEGQILLTKQKLKPLETKPEIIDLTKAEPMKSPLISKEKFEIISKPLGRYKFLPIQLEKLKPIQKAEAKPISKEYTPTKSRLVPILDTQIKPISRTKTEAISKEVQKEISKQKQQPLEKQISKTTPISTSVERLVQYPRPYLDQYWIEAYDQELATDVVALTKDGEKETRKKGKRKYKEIVKYKKRISPIFSGAEKIFEENPIKTTKVKSRKTNKKQFWET